MLKLRAKINCVTILLPLVVSQYVATSDEVKLPNKYDEIIFRVSDGVPAKLGTVPYQVSLRRGVGQGKYFSFCGGSLISPQKILSAGHCFAEKGNTCQNLCKKVQMKEFKRFYVVAGSLLTKSKYKKDGYGSEQWRRIRSAAVAPGHESTKNDIAVAFTTKPFKFNENVKALPFATKNNLNENKAECVISGYGRLNRKKLSKVLMYGHVKMLSKSKCSSLHRRNMNKYICINSPDKTKTQKGDSGGPLVCKKTGDRNDNGDGVIVGVVAGSRRIKNKWHSYLTRVSSFKNFIRKKATKNCPVFIIVWISLILNFA